MQLANVDIEARLAPVKWESGTRTPSTRSQKSTSSTSANESIPAWDNGLFSSNSTPSATKLVRANSQSFAAIFLGSVSGIIAGSGLWRGCGCLRPQIKGSLAEKPAGFCVRPPCKDRSTDYRQLSF